MAKKLLKLGGGTKTFSSSIKTVPLGKHKSVGVECTLSKPPSLDKCDLLMMNSSAAPVCIEMSGAMLLPEAGQNFQRLMVAGAQDLYETSVRLAPGEERKFTLETCCMDRGKPAPSGHTTYSIGPDVAPPSLLKAARGFVGCKALDRVNKGKGSNDLVGGIDLSKVQAVCWGGKL